MAGPAATGSFTRDLIGELRGDVAAVDDESRRRARRARAALLAAFLVLVLTGPLALVVAIASSTTTAEEVAARVAPAVFQQLVAESRAQRVMNARGVLGAANQVLADRGLPMVADPGPGANAEQVLAAASSAQVLSVLPEEIVTRLRDQLDGRPIVLPSADVTAGDRPDQNQPDTPPGPGPATDGPGLPPGAGDPAAPPAPAPGQAPSGPPQQTAAPPPPGPQPAPAPIPTRRRLIPPLVPLPLPLIGT